MRFEQLVIFVLTIAAAGQATAAPAWRELTPIPDKEGFASVFAGVSNGVLIVAGGANITGNRWQDPMVKKWYESVFVLDRPDGNWQSVAKLPHPCAYGVSVTTSEGIVCVGGSDSTRHFPDVFKLQWQDGGLRVTPLPALPQPCAQGCGALLGNTIYIAGGIDSPTATAALKTFWALDLDQSNRQWKEVEPWPGPERMLAVAGVQDDSFFLFSGARLRADASGKPVREYLTDAYRFTPGKSWQRIADPPRAVVAAASPAIPLTAAELMIVSGNDGTKANFQPLAEHPGFPRDALVYDSHRDQWRNAGAVPFSLGDAPVVIWHDAAVLINGEVRPRVRTPTIWSLPLR